MKAFLNCLAPNHSNQIIIDLFIELSKTTQYMNEIATKTPELPKIKPKHLKFVQRFMECGNATQAYKDAGYTGKGAQPSSSALLSKPIIQTYITRYQEIAQKEHEAIFGSVVKRVDAITREAERGKPMRDEQGVVLDEHGKVERESDTFNSLKGLDQLAKLGRLYQPEAIAPPITIIHNALNVIHAPGAIEASDEERKRGLSE